MKKQLVIAVALIATLGELNAGIVGNAFDTAGNLADDALNVPGDVLVGRDRPYRREGLFGRRRDYNDSGYSQEFADENPEL